MRLENLDDGSKLEAAWTDALTSSLSYFRALLASSSSSAWKPVSIQPLTSSTVAHDDGKSKAHESTLKRIHAGDVAVHRRTGKGGEVYRAVVEVDCGLDVGIDTFRGCLVTPETRPHWDRMVEEATTLDLLDAHTRVGKTNYRLGWPSSPRDVVTISKTLVDQHTLIDITTSLPRSKHEPAYLRPSPPYVRAHVTLLAWCIQLPSSASTSTDKSNPPPEGKARITCFWSWNPKGTWAVGGGVPQHLPSLVVGLVDYVREGSEKVPVLLSYGPDVSIGAVGYDTARVTLSVGYAIVNDHLGGTNEGLRRQVEFGLSSTQSWDVQIHVKTQNGEESPSIIWTSFVGQAPAPSPNSTAPKRLILRFAHAALSAGEELVRVKVSIEQTSSSSTSGVRINGIPIVIEPMSVATPKRPLLAETASTSGISFRTMSTIETMTSNETPVKRISPSMKTTNLERNIASIIKRNYIYFTSLLQEPEAKWRPVVDSRGVAVHQLNSIDKTLVVFRAEAVFVGVGIWDLFATIGNPGARLVWDKTHEEASLLEDVNELSDLWYSKSRAAWPVAARDSVMLRTTYKSPSSVHIFGFSVDNTDLFPRIPPSIDPNTIRTQIDLQGWSIESLSPNTTQVTLLEQSDPRGWSNKSSIPQVMMTTLAGIGEFAIKHGAPPICTRLGGARALLSRYDVEKESYRFEYECADERRSTSSGTVTAFPFSVAIKAVDTSGSDAESLKSLEVPSKLLSNIDCEIRCDADTWANSFTIVIDPPPAVISALKRHRLSSGGGGLWLTIEHDSKALGAEKVVITVRRGVTVPGAKTTVNVNGSKIRVDIEDLRETDVKLLQKQRRSRPTRAPLDHPPALGTLRKRQSTLDINAATPSASPRDDPFNAAPSTSTYSRIAAPLTRWYSVAAESTRAAIVPVYSPPSTLASGSTPVDAAVRALAQLARMHADRDGESTDPFGWQPVSERDGLKVEKRIVPHVSDTFPVFRAGRIIEGFTAEDVSAAISTVRKDERFEQPVRLQSFGHGITTSQVTAHTSFPFRARSLLVSTIVARLPDGPPPTPSVSTHTSLSTILHASTSGFDSSALNLDPAKYNPLQLSSGNLLLEGWILETIDPYSHEQYAIPSTRCLYVGAIDYSGNIPLSINNMLNSSLPRALLSVEAALRANGPPSRARIPAMCVSAPEASSIGPWALEGLDKERLGVDQRNDVEGYDLSVIIHATAHTPRDTLEPPSPILRHTDSRTSVHSNRSTVIDLAEEMRRGKRDLVVLEVELASQLITSGADIQIRGVSLPIAQHNGRNDAILPLRMVEAENLELPFKCQILSLAPSVLQSASLDPNAQSRHLLRISLPTSGYEAPINDPLLGKSPLLPRPRWLLDLINDGAFVRLSVRSRKGEGEVGYWCGGEMLAVEDEKKVRSAGRDGSRRLPQLVGTGVADSAPLDKPLAIAREFLPDTPPPIALPVDVPSNDAEPSIDLTATDTTIESPVSITAQPNGDIASVPSNQVKRSSYTFWNYPRLRRSNTVAPLSNGSIATLPSSQTLAPEKIAARPPTPVIPSTATITPLPVTAMAESVISLPVFIIACIVSFLLGSLIRSLLAEADFVINTGNNLVLDQGKWRELRRLVVWRISWNWDFILGITKRT